MNFEWHKLKDIVNNLDNIRKPLNEQQRKEITRVGKYPYCGANGIVDYIDEYIFDDEILCIAEDGSDWSFNKKCTYIMKEKCWVNNHTHVVTPKEGVVVQYLSYYLNYIDLSNKITGTTRGKLTKSALNDIDIYLPDYDNQQKVANVLDKAQELIDKRKEQIEACDELIKSLFYHMFGSISINPYNYKMVYLEDVCNKITDGKHGGCILEKDTGYYFVGAREIYDGKIHYETAQEILSSEFEKDYKRCNIENGDFVIVNTGATIGKTAIANSELTCKTLLQKSVALLKVKKDLITSKFLQYCYIINSDMYVVKSASAQPNLLLSRIRKTQIYLPPLQLQNEFAQKVEKIEQQKQLLEQSLTELENNFNSLMQRAFKGELF